MWTCATNGAIQMKHIIKHQKTQTHIATTSTIDAGDANGRHATMTRKARMNE